MKSSVSKSPKFCPVINSSSSDNVKINVEKQKLASNLSIHELRSTVDVSGHMPMLDKDRKSPKKQRKTIKELDDSCKSPEIAAKINNQKSDLNHDILITPSKDESKKNLSKRCYSPKKKQMQRIEDASICFESGVIETEESKLTPQTKLLMTSETSSAERTNVLSEYSSESDKTGRKIGTPKCSPEKSNVFTTTKTVEKPVTRLTNKTSWKSPANTKKSESCTDMADLIKTKDKMSCRKIKSCTQEINEIPLKPKSSSRSSSKSSSPNKRKPINLPISCTGGLNSDRSELNLNEDISKVILDASKVPFPSNFKYKYQYSGKSLKPLGLNSLIEKVNNSIKEVDTSLTALFGEAEEPDYCDGDAGFCPNIGEINDSTDSDKTVTEFDLVSDIDKDETALKEQSKIHNIKSDCTNINAEHSQDNANTLESVEKKLPVLNNSMSADNSNHEDINSEAAAVNETHNSVLKKDADECLYESAKDGAITSVDQILNKANDHLDETTSVNKIKLPDVNCFKGTVEINSVSCSEDNEAISIFEMYGLTLKTKKIEDLEALSMRGRLKEATEETDISVQKYDYALEDHNIRQLNKLEVNANIVNLPDIIAVDSKIGNEVVILSDYEIMKGIDRSGVDSLKETKESNKCRPKFTTINKIIEPKPLEVLNTVEKAESDKKAAFSCDALEQYINVNKDIAGSNSHLDKEPVGELEQNIKEELEKAEPDIDEVDGQVFVSFSSDKVLEAHIFLEKQLDWLQESQLKKMAHLKLLKERQQYSGSQRVTDVKSSEEMKQNYRGIPMRMIKYLKLLKLELENILRGRPKQSNTSQKTQDITKVKGWKNKINTAEELKEAAGINVSELGKVHWKTEERLLKSIDPDEAKDIGLDLKKKRRKLVSYSNKKRNGNKCDIKCEKEEELEFDYEIDDSVITEKDVYNEDESKQLDLDSQNMKFSSQQRYGARKLFVKKMKLNSGDERILKKLGTQKLRKDDEIAVGKRRKRKPCLTTSKVTQIMAIAAISALDKKLIAKAKTLTETGKVSKHSVVDKKIGKDDVNSDAEYCFEVPKKENNADMQEDECKHDDEENRQSKTRIKEEKLELLDSKADESTPYKFRARKKLDKCQSAEEDEGHCAGQKKGGDTSETCNQLGCRYGCICHLCKLSDSSEEKEADIKPLCDKEYCRLGCICDSMETKTSNPSRCRKATCVLECKCPPKQPKPDIPRERDRREKKKKKSSRKTKSPEQKDTDNAVKEEPVASGDNNDDWEPPSKRKKNTNSGRFANLPRRESTYRLAKNLDAVSRKAMEVYATSEMFAEQKSRRRKSDPILDEGCHQTSSMHGLLDSTPDTQKKNSQDTCKDNQNQGGHTMVNPVTGMLEISDSDSDSETYPEDSVSCARLLPYQGQYRKRVKSETHDNNDDTSKKVTPPPVISLIDTDMEEKAGDKPDKPSMSDRPSTSAFSYSSSSKETVTEKLGLARNIKKPVQDAAAPLSKWKTQMVCLKAKKKLDEKCDDFCSEIKLLEIISNCSWENDRQHMLSKISHIISKDPSSDYPESKAVVWGTYILQFLPKAEKPAVIPPELKSKLPNVMYSIRIQVTLQSNADEKTKTESVVSVDEQTSEDKAKQLTEAEKKKLNLEHQEKLIDKIKFAEKLRNLIIAEEEGGVKSSKFAVSREDIEKALKRYKTQLWKAYTGNNNMTIVQLKQALQAAKATSVQGTSEHMNSANVKQLQAAESNKTGLEALSSTLARIQTNQGLQIICQGMNEKPFEVKNAFVPLTNINLIPGIPTAPSCARVPSPRAAELSANSEHATSVRMSPRLPFSGVGKALENPVGIVADRNPGEMMLIPVTNGAANFNTAVSGQVMPIHSNGHTVIANGSKLAAQIAIAHGTAGTSTVVPILPQQQGTANLALATDGTKAVKKYSKPILNPALLSLSNPSLNGQQLIVKGVKTGLTVPIAQQSGSGGTHVFQTLDGQPIFVPVSGSSMSVNGQEVPLDKNCPILPQVVTTSLASQVINAVHNGQTVVLTPVTKAVGLGVGSVSCPAVKQVGLVRPPYISALTMATTGRTTTPPLNGPFLIKTITNPLPYSGFLHTSLPTETQQLATSQGIYPVKYAHISPTVTAASSVSGCVQMGADTQGLVGQPAVSRLSVKLVPTNSSLGCKQMMLIPISNSSLTPEAHCSMSDFSNNPVPSSIVRSDCQQFVQTGCTISDTNIISSHVLRSIVSPEAIKSCDLADNLDNMERTNKRTEFAGALTKDLDIDSNGNNMQEDAADNNYISSNRPILFAQKTDESDEISATNVGIENVESVVNDSLLASFKKSSLTIDNNTKHQDSDVRTNSEISVLNIESFKNCSNTSMVTNTENEISSYLSSVDTPAHTISETCQKIIQLNSSSKIVSGNFADLNRSLVIHDSSDDECLLIDTHDYQASQSSVEKTKNCSKNRTTKGDYNKRKRKPSDFLDEIGPSARKVFNKEHFIRSVVPTINKQDSEQESEVDILSFEANDSCHRPIQLHQGRSKSRHKLPKKLDNSSTKKVNKDCLKPVFERAKSKNQLEKSRRLTMKHLFDNLETVVFKYNSKVKTFQTGVPKGMVLHETVNLIQALQHKMNRLQECLDDGRQYQKTLEAQLKQHIESLVSSGLPVEVIKNFLKSVAKAAMSLNTDKDNNKRSQLESEDSDTDLQYTRITSMDVLKNSLRMSKRKAQSPNADELAAPLGIMNKKSVVAASYGSVKSGKGQDIMTRAWKVQRLKDVPTVHPESAQLSLSRSESESENSSNSMTNNLKKSETFVLQQQNTYQKLDSDDELKTPGDNMEDHDDDSLENKLSNNSDQSDIQISESCDHVSQAVIIT